MFHLSLKDPDGDPRMVTFTLEGNSFGDSLDDVSFKVNEKYVCLPGYRQIRMYNRWTGRLVNVLQGPKKKPWIAPVNDVQLNERVIAVQARHQSDNCSITVYDLEHLDHI